MRSIKGEDTIIGRLRYAVVEGWKELPKGCRHRSVPDVAVDSRDRVSLLVREHARVIVYKSDGTFVTSCGDYPPSVPHGGAIGRDEPVYWAGEGGHTLHKPTPGSSS